MINQQKTVNADMKRHSQSRRWFQSALVGLGFAISTTGVLAVPDLVLGTFDSDITGWGTAWGNAAPQHDPAEDNTGNGGGSCYISADFALDQNTLTVYGVIQGNPWWDQNGANFNFSDYKSVEFDIKWDNNQSVSVADFNNPPMGGEGGIAIWAVTYPTFGDPYVNLGYIQVPAEAATGWAHISLPIDPTIARIDPSKGIVLKKWITAAQRDAGGTYAFWVDNVVLKGTDAPPPPPSLSLEKPIPGLMLVAASGGQWDRQNIRTVANGYSWVGAPGPVSYSVNFAKHSDTNHPDFQFHMYFVPGIPDAGRADPDWHHPNVLMWRIVNLADGAAWSEVRFKTNAPDDNGILWGEGSLGGVWNATPLGNWTITFEQDANITVTTPGGGTLQTNLPPDVVSTFNDTLQVYVGIAPNSLARIGQMAVVTNVKITGAPGAPDIDSDFVGKPLDPAVWEVVAATPLGVQQIPPDAAYWVNWTLPALGFGLEGAATVKGPWRSPAPLGFDVSGIHRVLLTTGDLPDPNAGFWRLIKREFKKLQILLPGETAAPGTPTGKTGTPLSQAAGIEFTVTVNAVDDNWNPVTTAYDVVHLASTDEWAIMPPDAALANGTRTFAVTLYSPGEQTITVTDVTDPTKTEDTSSPITVTE